MRTQNIKSNEDSLSDFLQVKTELGHVALDIVQRIKLLEVQELLPGVNDLPLDGGGKKSIVQLSPKRY